ncbi:M15 family metallopeptidase [uncultured Oscillibacter sp.]|uniref:M15 family metallopeptidase n=1 Tax=uncultured Oscillibacter sp. TaxID=876091 RepID=UPI0025DF1CF9|nr:M15 family metallopeptidase [uncultured Oscillibacter sp.]
MTSFSERILPLPDPMPPVGRAVPPARRAARRRRRRVSLAVSALTGVFLFGGGFLLGRAAAVQTVDGLPGEDAPPVVSLSLREPVRMPEEPVTAAPAASSAPTTGPAPAGEPETADDGADWELLLVNGEHPLAEDFAVPELKQLKNGHAIDSRAYPALQEMMDAARAAGCQPLICSSFRTWDKQASLFERKVRFYQNQGYGREEAERQAAVWVARPGTSEHQAGLAVDIVDVSYQLLDEGQEETPAQKWLMAHCAEYGFILRYPTEKSDLTGVGYEPWHYRYVGRDAAREITEQGLCLEEYLAG